MKQLYESIEFNRFNRPSPVECYKLTIIGIFLTITFVSSVAINGFLLWLFYWNKGLRTPINHFIVIITVLNFVGAFLEFPLVIISNFECGYIVLY
jgi:hypothetical protein